MFLFEHKIRVRYADTDQMGVVYYGNYATFYETGRTESFRHLGLSYKSMEEEGIMLPVLENWSKFIKPAKYDDLLTVKTMLKEMPNSRIRFDYEIFNEKGDLLNIGYTILVFLDSKSFRPMRMPESIKSLLDPYFQEKIEELT
ncbi:acyl-CoA thioesterase [Sediminitomix flava]|uniref:Acyl-CoA thioester hydrolase n=1 Tax=Sediminitomix flava TaxID=379075 RepID=A0A315ZJV0_SEDFL|nr:thioesterase family protein [Sediminitomix flava]PWJ44964.1 acyl-CoA thioester hydrolase [Sediminitomix flava]